MRALIALAIALALVPAASAQKTGQTPGAPNPCTLFTPADIAGYLGEPVESGDRDTLTTSCSWYGKGDDSDSFAMLTIWPRKEADTPSLSKTMKAHPELGEGGYAIKDINIVGSWTGGAVMGGHFYRVMLIGPKASEAQTVAWLKAVKAKRG